MSKGINILMCLMLAATLLSSCMTQRKMAYFNKVEQVSDSINAHYKGVQEPVIRVSDKLVILVSALDPEAAMPFNLPALTSMTPGKLEASTIGQIQYYTVDNAGYIVFPVLGRIHVAGLTKSELVNELERRIGTLVNNPVITINFVGYQVTVIGEVNVPGRYEVSAERTSVLDALAMAGDLTVYGKRDNVLLTREQDGRLEFVRLNLNSPDLFISPYFYLQQNDVIYVEPNKVRAVSSQNLPLYLSMITTLASMATVIVSVVNTTQK